MSTPTSESLTIRPAQPEDGEVILRLIDALAVYEKLDPPSAEAKERLLRDAFAPQPRFSILLAETAEGVACGYAFFLETYSTFLALPTLYLEDLFVLPEYRGVRAGSALFEAVKAEARRRGCGRMEFLALDWNHLAREFYARKGAKHMDNWCFYRVDGEALQGS